MDIETLSGMIRNILLERDEVALPGIGAFVAEMAPASFSDKGYTINPPYRRLTFRERTDGLDSLSAHYALQNGLTIDQATEFIAGIMSALRHELEARKTVSFPGLGRLRITRENNIFFIADEDADIFPDGFCLEKISLKSRGVADAIDLYPVVSVPAVEEAPAPAAEPLPVPEPESEPVVAEESKSEPEAVAEPETEAVPEAVANPEVAANPKSKRSVFKTICKVILWLVVVAGLLFSAFMLLSDFAPDFIDSLLYTEEELQILNH